MLQRNESYFGDCLELMKEIEDKTVNLIVADIPYYKVMVRTHNGEKVDWDSIWDTLQDYINWCELLAIEYKRILTDNGTLYLFGDDKIIAYLQVLFDKYFNLENSIVWQKPNNMTIKGWAQFRSYAPITERILMYSNEVIRTGLEQIKLDVNNFLPLRQYFKDLQQHINLPKSKIVEVVGQQADHCFRHSSSQWDMPTIETYNKFIDSFLIDKWEGYKEYEVLRQEYEVLRQEYEVLRRPFNIDSNHTDVWVFNIISPSEKFKGGHVTQKPLKLIERIISVSSNEGDLVLDNCAGSMTTAIACLNLNRDFIMMEKNEKNFLNGKERIEAHIDKLLAQIEE